MMPIINASHPWLELDKKTSLLMFHELTIARWRKNIFMRPHDSLESQWGAKLKGMQTNAIQGGYMKTDPSW